ncbi:MAG: hypothetical protein ACRC57_13735 [Sarcina sp.]
MKNIICLIYQAQNGDSKAINAVLDFFEGQNKAIASEFAVKNNAISMFDDFTNIARVSNLNCIRCFNTSRDLNAKVYFRIAAKNAMERFFSKERRYQWEVQPICELNREIIDNEFLNPLDVLINQEYIQTVKFYYTGLSPLEKLILEIKTNSNLRANNFTDCLDMSNVQISRMGKSIAKKFDALIDNYKNNKNVFNMEDEKKKLSIKESILPYGTDFLFELDEFDL